MFRFCLVFCCQSYLVKQLNFLKNIYVLTVNKEFKNSESLNLTVIDLFFYTQLLYLAELSQYLMKVQIISRKFICLPELKTKLL